MVRPLAEGDAAEALALLRARPLANVFLEHVIRSGALGRMPGIFGCQQDGRLIAVVMIAPGGGTALEVVADPAFALLAEWVAKLERAPRHIVGCESVTVPFWRAYQPLAGPLRWTRRESLYRIDRARLRAAGAANGRTRLRRARESDLEAVVLHSARQHLEDLGDDRLAADPEGFRAGHLSDLRGGRWWLAREAGRLCFQVHVGPHNDHTVQIGGVFTPPDLRGRGHATRNVAALVDRLLDVHPSVTLFCDEQNQAARRVYERIGFERVANHRSYLLDGSASCPPS